MEKLEKQEKAENRERSDGERQNETWQSKPRCRDRSLKKVASEDKLY